MSKFAAGFPASFNSCRCTAVYSAIIANSCSIKPNQEIIIYAWMKSYQDVAIQVQVFQRKPKKQRLFSPNKKLKALTEKKENHFYGINCIYDKILTENTFRNKQQELVTQYAWNRPAL